MTIFTCDSFPLPLPAGHRFPLAKYALLGQRVAAAGFAAGGLRVPRAASYRELSLAHLPDYIHRVLEGRLPRDQARRLGLPWSPELVERSLRSCGATLEAASAALVDGLAASLAGGTHHAFADRPEGFCVFNDCAVAALDALARRLARHVLILDCDVHQGNGTAAILAGNDAAYTFSIHGERNFPFRKEQSDLDIGLPDQTTDGSYLEALERGVRQSLDRSAPDLAFYLAGADPLAGDRFGRLALTKEGLAARDRLVLNLCRGAGVPVAIVMAGGYAPRIEDTVDVHFQTIAIAHQCAHGWARSGPTR